jgi:4-oxalocrotonate tautomerase
MKQGHSGEETMPLVRIDLRQGKDDTYRQGVGRIVHEALVSVGVPEDDRFQVIAEHEAANFVFDPNYLGVRRTEDLVMIQITWNEGRTLEQKKALYKAIADRLAEGLSLRREDVLINLVEVRRENWSFGAGIAQYAT